MNLLLILIILFITYILYKNNFEHYTDDQTTYAKKIFTFLNSSDKTYIKYLTFLNSEKIPEPKLFNTEVYNNLNDSIKTNRLTLDNLDIIYEIINF